MLNPNIRLVASRKAKGLRQLDIALKAGVCPATVWSAEHGRKISIYSQKKIAAALGVGISDIFAVGAD